MKFQKGYSDPDDRQSATSPGTTYDKLKERWNVDQCVVVAADRQMLRTHVTELLEKKKVRDVDDAISALLKEELIDRTIFLRLLCEACLYRYRWVHERAKFEKREKQIRTNLKKLSKKRATIRAKLQRGLKILLDGHLSYHPDYGLSEKDFKRMVSSLEQIRSSSFFSERSVPYEKKVLTLHFKPVVTLYVYVYEAVRSGGAQISNDLKENVGRFYRVWELGTETDPSDYDLGDRFRQAYKTYEGQFRFDLTSTGVKPVELFHRR